MAQLEALKPLCRQIAAEGSVLLKNDSTLPFSHGTRVAVFGRMQETYVKSGTGSGGLVHVEKEPCLLESLRAESALTVDETLAAVYADWIREHPFDNGHGWATEPWSQIEMPLNESTVVTAAQRNDAALVIVGRTAGEDRDNADEVGSYRLSDEEEQMLRSVSQAFERVVVVLNVGSLIDLSFMNRYKVSALLYVWQGGMMGADALVDMLVGRCSPCGKMPDTQALDVCDHLSNAQFGDAARTVYEEDIFVGYRYFETAAPDRVQFPFGFGLTYTEFDVTYTAHREDDRILVDATVRNCGTFAAKEVVQVYVQAPCATLGTPIRQLCGFAKTRLLQPDEQQTLTIAVALDDLTAFDDSGVSGYRNAYVREAGEYVLYAGVNVRDTEQVFAYTQRQTVCVRQCEEVMAPTVPFERYVAVEENGVRRLCKAAAPLGEVDVKKRIAERRPAETVYTGDVGVTLNDVANGRYSVEAFVAQMTDEELCELVCAEGMRSEKVRPGTASAFGGMTESLDKWGIPRLCCTDGPSGIRLDNGDLATSIPNGTLLAATFDDALVEELHRLLGEEMCQNDVDILLSPGMNLHRHPLNGRNFEYFSEDPLLCGKMAAAVVRGLAHSGRVATLKHFCCNSQERNRFTVETLVSQRALRELYLRGFEIAVREGGAQSIMTAYNLVNGYHCASHYDLTTTVLRGEWGFDGIVMTDWGAYSGKVGSLCSKTNLKAMIRAQNDLYMVCADATTYEHNLKEGLREGYITRAELARSCVNILRFILRSPRYRDAIKETVDG